MNIYAAVILAAGFVWGCILISDDLTEAADFLVDALRNRTDETDETA